MRILSNLRVTSYLALFFIFSCATAEPILEQKNSLIKTNPNTLTTEEKNWLASHPEIKLAPDPQFAPIEYFDETGSYQGIAADYVSSVEEKLGIKFKIVRLKNWDEILAQSKTKTIDMWGAATPTPQRLEYMLFTKPFLELPAAIFTQKSLEGKLDLKLLKGSKIVVLSGYGIHDFLKNHYPKIQVEAVSDISVGLRKLEAGEVKAMIANSALASYYIQKEGIKDLRVAGQSGFFYEWGFAARKDWPILNRILQKTIDAIEEEE